MVVIGCGLLAIAACAGKVAQSAPDAGSPAASAYQQSRPAVSVSETVSLADSQAKVRGADAAGSRHSEGQTGAAADPVLARGDMLYTKYCTICHGENGDGAGKFAYLMNPRPRDFKQGNFKLSTTQNLIPTDEDLVRTISRGMPGSAMPPWEHMPVADLQALAKRVRQFHIEGTGEQLRKWVAEGSMTAEELPAMLAKRTNPGASLGIPPEPIFDEIRWFRGRRLYLENCASCHGVDGNPVASEVKLDAEGYPVPPRSFVNGIFKGGSEPHQLYARIIKGMKGTPMPASEGLYSDDEVWDLIHYTQSLARAGAQQRAQLRQGTFAATNIRRALPTDPMDTACWDQARPLYVAMTPLWWVEDRIEGVVVQALHNGEELAIRLSWIDPTLDDRTVRHEEFRDGVAIQFSLSADPPFYMGSTGDNGGVNIWFWKADRQRSLAKGYQDVDSAYPDRAVDMYPEQRVDLVATHAMSWPLAAITEHDPQFITAWGAGNLVADPTLATPVESLVAHGPGTLSGKPAGLQSAQGKAVYERGVWYVQLQRRMAFPGVEGHGDERIFRSGDYLPVSFAIFNGSAGDRDGKKNISIWQKLVIE